MNQGGLGLDTDTLTKQRGKLARLFGHGDNRRTISNADNPAGLPVQSDDIASTETEWSSGFHWEF